MPGHMLLLLVSSLVGCCFFVKLAIALVYGKRSFEGTPMCTQNWFLLSSSKSDRVLTWQGMEGVQKVKTRSVKR